MATYYWVGGSGTWDNSSTTNWAASSGGAGGSGPPLSTDNVVFDANSGTAATVTIAATAACNNCTINKSDINLSLSGNFGPNNVLTLTTGTMTLNSYSWTCLAFASTNSNTRAIAFGTGKMIVTGNALTIFNMGTVTGFSCSGSRRVDLSYAGATGTRNIFFANDSAQTADVTNTLDFYVTAGTDTVSVVLSSQGGSVRTLDTTGFSGTLGTPAFRIYGNLNLSSTTTVAATTGIISFLSTTTGNTITTNGVTIDRPFTFNGVGGSWTLQDNLTLGSTRAMTLTNGTLDANGKNVTIGTFALGAGTKTLTLGGGTWTVAGATWNANTNVTGLTVSASTGTINMTSASAKTFSGGAKTWPTLNQGGAGNLTIAQSNTFANITNTVQPATVRLTAGTTQTVSAFSVSGTSGNLITLDTTVAGTQATLSDPSGVVSVSFCSIKDINATGGAFWQAYTVNGNVDGGNNLGWDFNAAAWSYMYNVRKSKRILPGV